MQNTAQIATTKPQKPQNTLRLIPLEVASRIRKRRRELKAQPAKKAPLQLVSVGKLNSEKLCNKVKNTDRSQDLHINNYLHNTEIGGEDMKILIQRNNELKLGILPSPGLSYHKDCYFKKFNGKYGEKSTLKNLFEYLDSLLSTHKKLTVRNIAMAFKRSIRNKLGELAEYPGIKTKLDRLSDNYKTRYHDTKRALPIEEISKLVRLADTETSVIVEFLFHTAMRISELINAKWENCRQMNNGNWLVKFQQKGKKYNEIEVCPKVMKRVQKAFKGKSHLFENRNGKPYNFDTLNYRIKTRSLKFLGYKITSHEMRRSFATHMVRSGKSIKAIMKRMGSTSVAAFMKHYVWMEHLDLSDIPSVSSPSTIGFDAKDSLINLKQEKENSSQLLLFSDYDEALKSRKVEREKLDKLRKLINRTRDPKPVFAHAHAV